MRDELPDPDLITPQLMLAWAERVFGPDGAAQELSRQAGTHNRTFWRWVHGQSSPRLCTVGQWYRVLRNAEATLSRRSRLKGASEPEQVRA